MHLIANKPEKYASRHALRVRRLLNMVSTMMVLAGIGWGAYFGSRGQFGLMVADAGLVLIGITMAWLTRQEKTRAASTLLIVSLWFILGVMALVQDIPTAAAPRSIHHFFLALGIGAYMLFRDESAWIRHGAAMISMALFFALGSSNWGIHTDMALPDEVRVAGTWINNALALILLYGSLHLMQTDLTEHGAISAAIRKGLQHKQFVLHFQPQVGKDGRITGAEALVRWNHPTMGLTPPNEFIPEAEESGLIVPLGYWILEEACQQMVNWSSSPALRGLSLSVNVSSQQFRQTDFVPRVLAALDRSGAQPQLLKLELTESMLVKDIDDVIDKMAALRERGVRLSLDDFGTGFSSLNYLKRLPLDQLKIDQSFVRDVMTNVHDAAIARTVVTLGHSLGLDVIAEGVETQAQRDFLADMGCKAYQGFLFSKPLPVDDFVRFVSEHLDSYKPVS